MKTKIILCCAMLALSSMAAADTQSDSFRPPEKMKARWNPITIYNNSGSDIAYVMSGVYGGATYAIKNGGTDVYHSGVGDQYATFQVGKCLTAQGQSCVKAEKIADCLNNVHYNAELIKTIYVNSLTSCTAVCLDGGDTSCKQSG